MSQWFIRAGLCVAVAKLHIDNCYTKFHFNHIENGLFFLNN